MVDTAIKVENLAKRYRINTLRNQDTLASQIKTLLTPWSNSADENSDQDYVWALNDLNFTVNRGEVVAIIGKNGSGKSTLLKLISRIIRPTRGRIELHGRVASLLEVGTGFHPELSGRENVFMNGAILGMSREEIRKKFDEIVDFAEVGRFIDTPIKRYSSGMHTRLAFAVAAHLEPDILLIDEVLAVGDTNFQQKSLGKMNEVAGQGRTVLFVSHNMTAVGALCPRAILLSKGNQLMDAETPLVIKEYLKVNAAANGEARWDDLNSAPGSDKLKLRAVRLINGGEVTSDVDISKDLIIEIEFENFDEGAEILSAILLTDRVGADVLASANMHSATMQDDPWFGRPHPVGRFRTRCVIPADTLNDDTYNLNVFLQTKINHIEAEVNGALTFAVHDTSEIRSEWTGKWRGVVRPKLAWNTEFLSETALS